MTAEIITSPESRVLTPAEMCSSLERAVQRGRVELSKQGTEVLLPGVRITPETKLMRTPGPGAHPKTAALIRLATGEQIVCVIKLHMSKPITPEGPRMAKGLVEFSNHCNVTERGIKTVVPLAATVTDAGESLMVSQYDPRLQSASTVEWTTYNENATSEVEDFLAKTASILSEAHRKGVFPLDLQLKNIAIDRLTGGVFLYDWESAAISSVEQVMTLEQVRTNALRGIKVFLNSCYDDRSFRNEVVRSKKGRLTVNNLITLFGEGADLSPDEFVREIENTIRAITGREIDFTDTIDQEDYNRTRIQVLQRLGRVGLSTIQQTIRKDRFRAKNTVFFSNFCDLFFDRYLYFARDTLMITPGDILLWKTQLKMHFETKIGKPLRELQHT